MTRTILQAAELDLFDYVPNESSDLQNNPDNLKYDQLNEKEIKKKHQIEHSPSSFKNLCTLV